MNLPPDVLKKIEEARREGRVTECGVLGRTLIPAPALEPTVGTEAAFQLAVIDLAHGLGWACAHFRRVRVQRGDKTFWETPVAADGAGWPDLLLCRDRVIFAELKSAKGVLKPDQKVWRDRLLKAGQTWRLWRPKDWVTIVEVLS